MEEKSPCRVRLHSMEQPWEEVRSGGGFPGESNEIYAGELVVAGETEGEEGGS